jgi:Mn2+/Fe2+ NRAMP family transporter
MVLFLALINWIVIAGFGANMANLVALATFVSFVMAPVVGWMNLKTVTGKDVKTEYQPSKGLKVLSYIGMLFLAFFSIYYCWMVIIK